MAGKPNLRPVDMESQTCFREMDATAAQTCPEWEKNEIVEDTEYTQDGSGGVYDGVGTQPTIGAQIHTQFVQVERERERERDGTHRSNGSTDGSTTDSCGGSVPMVDVDAQKPIRLGRTKPYRFEKSQIIDGTWIDYWMWLCRPNPSDTEPKPLPIKEINEWQNQILKAI